MTSRNIRKWPVSFGNPALGTYSGFVYTTHDDARNTSSTTSTTNHRTSQHSIPISPPLVEGAEAVERMVAMVDVPPEQVPEGILHLARSHRPFIEHVRIVIAEKEPPEEENHDDAPPPPEDVVGDNETTAAAAVIPSLLKWSLSDDVAAAAEKDLQGDRSYLVLFHLLSENDANTMVEDLHGRPYTSLDETVTCSVHTVVALEGEGGVSLLNPLFAPSTTNKKKKKNKTKRHNGTTTNGEEESSSSDIAATTAAVTTTTTTTTTTSSSNTTNHHLTEDPNCAVCLEHMSLDPGDGDKTAILTTVCNHTFHLDCLVQCQDSPCPVCRYDHSGLNETLSQCHICGTTERNYVCLICGVVSCVSNNSSGGGNGTSSSAAARSSSRGGEDSCGGGRGGTSSSIAGEHTASATGTGGASHTARNRSTAATTTSLHHIQHNGNDPNNTESSEVTAQRFHTSHANQHYDETLHAYALDTETQHVWDFAGQGYVHRLLQNKEDGKLVEVTDPNNTTSQERSMTPGLSDAQEGEVVHRKLEGFASQYYTLLKSQLEQQRTFYEGRLEEIRREFAIKKANATSDKAELIVVLKQEKKQLSHRLVSVKRKKQKAAEDVTFLISMNESLEANKIPLERKIKQAQREQIDSREMFQKYLPALEEKVTTLMLQLEESLNTTNTPATAECAPDSS
jgi:hypothetical protein